MLHLRKASGGTERAAANPANAMIGRIPITDISPVVDCGQWPAKAVAG
ncbi:MAG: DUF3416 domain-containing protein, partial [Nonomuraea sp.]|nr:DUF3416 domain-containing protein [Nonomuraea sp.]